MSKLTNEQFNQLTRDQKREAILRFEEPDYIYQPDKTNNRLFRKEMYVSDETGLNG